MSPGKFILETTVSLEEAKEAVLKALDNKGYRVEEETDDKMVAKHPFSATYYPHTVAVLLEVKPGKTVISASINHRAGEMYLKRLSEELVTQLPPLPTRVLNPMQKPTSQEEFSYQTKMLNRDFNAGEQVIWSHIIQKSLLNKETTEKWFITNMRAIKQFPATKDSPQEKFAAIGWLDLSDSVVMNQCRRSKGIRVGSFAGVYGGGGFAGTASGINSGISMAFGDIVFLCNDKEAFRFQGISDPNEVNNLIKTLKKESANVH
jgi:hypothetical protein